MKPAWSVIFLTTLCGMAQGLMLALVGADLIGGGHVTPLSARNFFSGGAVICMVLTGLGLFASFFHLGRPERFWRSAAMWRTSWLSREVIAVPAFFSASALYAWAHYSGQPWAAALGVLCVICALALWVCTAMIYACLRLSASGPAPTPWRTSCCWAAPPALRWQACGRRGRRRPG